MSSYRSDTDTEEVIPTGYRDTSLASKEALAKKKNEYRRKIYYTIKWRGGMTCDEIEASLGIRHQTASCFIRFLTQDGLLTASNERRVTRAGRSAIVWQAAQIQPNPQQELF